MSETINEIIDVLSTEKDIEKARREFYKLTQADSGIALVEPHDTARSIRNKMANGIQPQPAYFTIGSQELTVFMKQFGVENIDALHESPVLKGLSHTALCTVYENISALSLEKRPTVLPQASFPLVEIEFVPIEEH